MSEAVPLLQRIHDQFDVFEREPNTDHSVIRKIAITDRPGDYRVTTYPGGQGYGLDGFAIDVSTTNGMLGGGAPVKIEASRDYGPLLAWNVEEQVQLENDSVINSGTLGKLPAREALILPGDSGFELFAELHDQVQGLRAPLFDALTVADIPINPTSFDFKELTGTHTLNSTKDRVIHGHTTTYVVRDKSLSIQVNLDASRETKLSQMPSDVVVYHSGIVEYGGREAALSSHALLAFTGLHSAIRQLYAR
jgi:hypothetical protein